METQTAQQWREVDIAFTGPKAANPYTDVDAWVIFSHESGRQLRRPLFWDGGRATESDSPPRNRRASGGGAFTPPGRTMTSSQPTAP